VAHEPEINYIILFILTDLAVISIQNIWKATHDYKCLTKAIFNWDFTFKRSQSVSQKI